MTEATPEFAWAQLAKLVAEHDEMLFAKDGVRRNNPWLLSVLRWVPEVDAIAVRAEALPTSATDTTEGARGDDSRFVTRPGELRRRKTTPESGSLFTDTTEGT